MTLSSFITASLCSMKAPMSGRVPLPAGPDDQHQEWTCDVMALRLATLTRVPEPRDVPAALYLVERNQQ